MEKDRLEQLGLRLPANAVDFVLLTRELASLEAQIEQADADLALRREALDRLKADRDALLNFRNFYVHFAGDGTETETPKAGPRPGTKRAAILELLADGREWNTEQIHRELVLRGVHADSAYSSLLSTLSNMFSAGELTRPRQGVYALPHLDDQTILEAEAYEN
jgi:hypothetical protein